MKRYITDGELKSDKRYFLSTVILIAYMIMMMRGSYINTEIYVTLGLAVLWHMSAFLENNGAYIKIYLNREIICILIYLVYVVLMTMFGFGLDKVIGATLSTISLFMGIPMWLYYVNNVSEKRQQRILIISLLIWLYYCVKALRLYAIYTNLGRELVSGSQTLYGNIAIGNPYALAFGSCLIGIVALSNILRFRISNNKFILVLAIAYITVLAILVYETQSTITTLIMMLTFIVILLFSQKANKNNDRHMLFIIAIFILILVTFVAIVNNIEKIGYLLIKVFGNTDDVFSLRMKALGESFLNSETESDLFYRVQLYKQSLGDFWKHPLIGGAYTEYSRGGEHSELFDMWSAYGILGGIPYILIFFISIKHNIQINKRASNIYIFAFVLMFTLNPFHIAQSNFALFFIIPLLQTVLGKPRFQNKNSKMLITINDE